MTIDTFLQFALIIPLVILLWVGIGYLIWQLIRKLFRRTKQESWDIYPIMQAILKKEHLDPFHYPGHKISSISKDCPLCHEENLNK